MKIGKVSINFKRTALTNRFEVIVKRDPKHLDVKSAAKGTQLSSKRYEKKPVEVEAIKWSGNNKEAVERFVGKELEMTESRILIIPTLEGDMKASVSDQIIKGINGEFYPCKANIFARTYTLLGD